MRRGDLAPVKLTVTWAEQRFAAPFTGRARRASEAMPWGGVLLLLGLSQRPVLSSCAGGCIPAQTLEVRWECSKQIPIFPGLRVLPQMVPVYFLAREQRDISFQPRE